MTPLNHLINYSSELSQRPSFFAKNAASRFITAVSIPFELLAILENTIKLPFQMAAAIVKIPAKILNVFADSMSLKEFESKLASPLDVITTAIKIAGFAIGLLFTATLGLLSPHKNFRLHCFLGLVSNFHAENLVRLAKENKQKEIDLHEKVIEARLKAILDAMRQQSLPATFLTDEQRNEIETKTGVICPPIQDLIESSITENPNASTQTPAPDADAIAESKNQTTIDTPTIKDSEIIPDATDLEDQQSDEISVPEDLPDSHDDVTAQVDLTFPSAADDPQQSEVPTFTVIPFEADLQRENQNTHLTDNQADKPEEGFELVNAG